MQKKERKIKKKSGVYFFFILLESTIIEQGTKEEKARNKIKKCKGNLRGSCLQKSRNWNINSKDKR